MSKVKVTWSITLHNNTSLRTTIAFYSHSLGDNTSTLTLLPRFIVIRYSLGGDTDNSNTAWGPTLWVHSSYYYYYYYYYLLGYRTFVCSIKGTVALSSEVSTLWGVHKTLIKTVKCGVETDRVQWRWMTWFWARHRRCTSRRTTDHCPCDEWTSSLSQMMWRKMMMTAETHTDTLLSDNNNNNNTHN